MSSSLPTLNVVVLKFVLVGGYEQLLAMGLNERFCSTETRSQQAERVARQVQRDPLYKAEGCAINIDSLYAAGFKMVSLAAQERTNEKTDAVRTVVTVVFRRDGTQLHQKWMQVVSTLGQKRFVNHERYQTAEDGQTLLFRTEGTMPKVAVRLQPDEFGVHVVRNNKDGKRGLNYVLQRYGHEPNFKLREDATTTAS
jgi:hypothetical protein